MLRAGFAEVDITPPPGTHKIGWLRDIVGDRVRDPLFARAALFASDETRVGFLQFDTLSIRQREVAAIRQRAEAALGLPAGHLLCAATHNHAGPAVANVGLVPCDEGYVARLV